VGTFDKAFSTRFGLCNGALCWDERERERVIDSFMLGSRGRVDSGNMNALLGKVCVNTTGKGFSVDQHHCKEAVGCG
jgi:hypothetical protein